MEEEILYLNQICNKWGKQWRHGQACTDNLKFLSSIGNNDKTSLGPQKSDE
jgi:hypothetical protein